MFVAFFRFRLSLSEMALTQLDRMLELGKRGVVGRQFP